MYTLKRFFRHVLVVAAAAIFAITLISGCDEGTNPVSTEYGHSDALAAKPNCDVDPSHKSCGGDDGGSGSGQKDVTGTGGLTFATDAFDVLTDNSSSLKLEAIPLNVPLTTNFSATKAWLASLDGDAGSVSGADVAAAISSGTCAVNRGKGKNKASDATLAALADGYFVGGPFSPVTASTLEYDKTANGAASDGHQFNGIVDDPDGNIEIRIGANPQLFPGAEAVGTATGDDIVYTGGNVYARQDRHGIACRNQGDSATATVTDPAP